MHETPDHVTMTKYENASAEAARLRAVSEAVLAITSELSVDRILQKIVDLAKDLVQARYAALGVAREDRRGLSQFVVSGVTQEQIDAMKSWPKGYGLLGHLLKEPVPLRVRDISKDHRSIGFPPNHPKMTSFLGVPIVSRGKILGNFYLTDKIGTEEFSKEDEDLIVLFAAHAAVAIENAWLYTATDVRLHEKIKEVEIAERRSRFLLELSDLLPLGQAAEEMPLVRVAAKVTDVLGDICCIYMINADGSPLRKVFYHLDPARIEAAEAFVEASLARIWEQVIGKVHSLFVDDITLAAVDYLPFDPELMERAKLSSAMALPIRTKQGVYGAFICLGSTPSRFTYDDFSFGSLVAERMGVAIENSKLLQELKDALKARDEFISIATHELKTPVAVLKGFAQAVARKKMSDPEAQAYALEAIDKQADRLAVLTNELLDVARLHAGQLELRPVSLDLVRLAQEVLDHFAVTLRDSEKHNFRLGAEEPEVWGLWDASYLDQILTNLIGNAVKYSPDGGDVVLRIKRMRDVVLVSVSDQGIGIPEAGRERLFETFYRVPNSRALHIQGMGLGLHITKELVERHGGGICFDSEEGKGATFFFTLPLNGAS